MCFSDQREYKGNDPRVLETFAIVHELFKSGLADTSAGFWTPDQIEDASGWGNTPMHLRNQNVYSVSVHFGDTEAHEEFYEKYMDGFSNGYGGDDYWDVDGRAEEIIVAMRELYKAAAGRDFVYQPRRRTVRHTKYATRQDVMRAFHNGDITKRSAAVYKANMTMRTA